MGESGEISISVRLEVALSEVWLLVDPIMRMRSRSGSVNS